MNTELLKAVDAYKHIRPARNAWDRWLLDKTMREDALPSAAETDLTEAVNQRVKSAVAGRPITARIWEGEKLEFEVYRPGDGASRQLPGYFHRAIRAIRVNRFPHYLTPYTQHDFVNFTLVKVKGLDAGLAIKPDGDVIAVHNNSTRRGIAPQLLDKAVEEGGEKLDHFDGPLSPVYAKHFPAVTGVEHWNDDYAPEGWPYTPVDLKGSHAESLPQDQKNAKVARQNYPQGKPHVVYRGLR